MKNSKINNDFEVKDKKKRKRIRKKKGSQSRIIETDGLPIQQGHHSSQLAPNVGCTEPKNDSQELTKLPQERDNQLKFLDDQFNILAQERTQLAQERTQLAQERANQLKFLDDQFNILAQERTQLAQERANQLKFLDDQLNILAQERNQLGQKRANQLKDEHSTHPVAFHVSGNYSTDVQPTFNFPEIGKELPILRSPLNFSNNDLNEATWTKVINKTL